MARWPIRPSAILLIICACGPRVIVGAEAGQDTSSDTDTDDSSDPPPPTSGTTSPSTTSTVSTSTDPAEPPDPTAGEPLGYCTEVCQTVSDCCHGDPACPGPYPNNWSCIDGACVHGGCSSDEQCLATIDEPWICAKTHLGAWCLPDCRSDQDCENFQDWECVTDESGRGYCWPANFCVTSENYDSCGRHGFCDPESSACRCRGDGDCEVSGFVCTFE
jgi:hypothetical protein